MLTNRKEKPKGDCEACERTDVTLTVTMPGNILMCDACVEINNEAVSKQKQAIQIVETARKQDAAIELKPDLFNAGTTAFIEIQAAIQNNPDITPDRKDYSVMVEVAARIDKLTAVIFADEEAITAKKNERHALLVNAQNLAAKLHEKEREQFKQYDVNYRPQTPKTTKPKPVKAPKPNIKAFSMKELRDACAKYNVSQFLSRVQMMAEARKIPAEQAAKELAEMMGLL